MAKLKPTHYATISLDIERWLGYTWQDIEDLSATLKLDLLGEQGMLLKSAQQNPRALNHILLTGLKHWSPQLRYEQVQDFVQEHLNKGGRMSDLNESILKAMRVGGFLDEKAGADEASSGPVGPTTNGTQTQESGAVGPGGEVPAPLATTSRPFPTE